MSRTPPSWPGRGLPRELLADDEQRRRALLIAGAGWLLAAAGLVAAPLLSGPLAPLAAVATTALALAGEWLLRRRRLLLAGHLVIAAAFTAAAPFAITTPLALAVVPLLAAQSAGRLAVHAWGGLCIATVLFLSPAPITVAVLLAVHLLAWLGERAREQASARADHVAGQLARADQEVERSHRLARRSAAASAAKSAYLATMSHELRNPLSAVIGYAELLAEDAESRGLPQMRDDLVRIATAGQHLRGLIEDILDLSPRDEGGAERRHEPFSAEELVFDVRGSLEPLARRRKNVLDVAFEGFATVTELDRERVRQVIVYLVEHALTFTAQGRVTVRARTVDDAARRSLTLVVEDTGVGVAEADLGRLFEPRSHGSSAGLGLSLCKQLVTSLRGTIDVRSQLGRGTTFTVRLPAGPSAPAAPAALDVAC